MPEGDTIHLTVARLRDALGHDALTRFETPRPVLGPRPEPGATIDAVAARGKHLLMTFAGSVTLHTHMQMTGSWRVYAPGEPWRLAPSRVRARVETERSVAVGVAAPVVELLDAAALRRHPVLNALGPDLCDPAPDLDEALARMDRLEPTTPVGVALLDQRVAAGVGNVYRSEVLWLCRQDPFASVGAVEATRRLGEQARTVWWCAACQTER